MASTETIETVNDVLLQQQDPLLGESINNAPLFKSYKRRFLVLLAFSFFSLSNAMMWITFSPISTSTMEHYNVNEDWVNMLSMVYMIVYIPGVIVASLIVEKFGMRTGLIVGGLLNALGAWIRCLPFPIAVLVGQIVLSTAQTFVLSTPVKISGDWFPVEERTMATTVGSIANQVGIMVGFYLSPLVAPHALDIPRLLLVDALIASLSAVTTIFLIQSSLPPLPPSATAIVDKPIPLLPSLKLVLGNLSAFVLTLGFGVLVGVMYALSTLINQIVEPFGYTQKTSGLLGAIIMFAGIPGMLVAGFSLQKTEAYRPIIWLFFFGSTASMVWFRFATTWNIINLIMSCTIFGFFGTGLMPISMEAIVECTYPVSENLSAGLVMMSSQVFGIAFIALSGYFFNTFDGDKEAARWVTWFLVGCSGFALLVILFFKPLSKRANANITRCH